MSLFGLLKSKPGLTTEPVTKIGTGIHLNQPTKIVPINIPDSNRKRHTFVFGTTGVGKTRLCENMIEQDIYKGNSIVYLDPKGDQQIFAKIVEIARKAGRTKDLLLVTPVFPAYSAVIDPMAFFFMEDELVGHIVSGINSEDPFYRGFAKMVASSVISANLIIGEYKREIPPQNLDVIRKCIRRAEMEKTVQVLQSIVDDPDPSVSINLKNNAVRTAEMLQDILEKPPEYYAKVSSSLITCLMDLSTGGIGKVIGQADSNRFISKLESKEPVIMVVHTGSMITREAGATLGKVVLSMIQSFVGRVYLSDRIKAKPPLSIYIDEAQSLFYQGVEDMFAKVGSADVMMTAFAQSVNQLYAAVGESYARSILDNTNTKIFMRCSDAETSEYVVKHFGKHKKLTGIYGSNQVTTREEEKDVLDVQDILSLQPQEFYMLTYTGRYKGRTLITKDPTLEIIFPPADIGGGGRFS